MATITLTSGDELVLLADQLLADLGSGPEPVAGALIDGSGGADTLTLDADLTGYTLAATPQGVLSVTTSAGTVSFMNFETLNVGGNQYKLGTAAADVIVGSSADDTVLYGLGGNDVMVGGAGADIMYGGLGADTYIVDNADDVVVELAGEGTDVVRSSVSYVLGDNVERLILTGISSINGTGNELDNLIVGTAAANIIDGGAGKDIMIGGLGSDVYYADRTVDFVAEKAGEGVDVVYASANYILPNNVENLILTGTAVAGIGNVWNNRITGNDANNILDGRIGGDIMHGGKGDDLYIVNQGADVVTELSNQGYDTVRASCTYTMSLNVETLVLTGAGSFNATGNTGANVIYGNAGANIIRGNLGRDVMTGGGGKDIFDFNSRIDSGKTATTRDVIMDFMHLTDRIDLADIDANTLVDTDQAFTFLAAKGAAFTGSAGQLRYYAAGPNTVIEADTNGDNIADFQIQLTGSKGLTAVDFIL